MSNNRKKYKSGPCFPIFTLFDCDSSAQKSAKSTKNKPPKKIEIKQKGHPQSFEGLVARLGAELAAAKAKEANVDAKSSEKAFGKSRI